MPLLLENPHYSSNVSYYTLESFEKKTCAFWNFREEKKIGFAEPMEGSAHIASNRYPRELSPDLEKSNPSAGWLVPAQN